MVAAPRTLVEGQRLSQPTFHALYQAMPPGTRAELTNGVVLMPRPVGPAHGRAQFPTIAWLSHSSGLCCAMGALSICHPARTESTARRSFPVCGSNPARSGPATHGGCVPCWTSDAPRPSMPHSSLVWPKHGATHERDERTCAASSTRAVRCRVHPIAMGPRLRLGSVEVRARSASLPCFMRFALSDDPAPPTRGESACPLIPSAPDALPALHR
jgi:hypothetical protein